MRFAYADPPYIGCANMYPEKKEVDHVDLVRRLVDEFPDGWGLSCHTPSLRFLLSIVPDDCRVGAWCKGFCAWKPNVKIAYAWEPLIFRGGRKRLPKIDPHVRDWHLASMTLRKGVKGAKPESFCRWFLGLMNVKPGDEVIDLFPGTGVMGRVALEYTNPIWTAEHTPDTPPVTREKTKEE